MTKLEFSYDADLDILTVEGQRYDGDLFRAFGKEGGMETGQHFSIERGEQGELRIIEWHDSSRFTVRPDDVKPHDE